MSEISPEFNLAVTRFCDYLSTLPFDTAMQIWGMMPRNSQLGEFAATILAGLPADFFNQTPSIEQRFVYKNGTVAMEAIVNADEQTPWPTPVEAASGLPAQAKIPTPTQRSMNSFMVFRSKCPEFESESLLLIQSQASWLLPLKISLRKQNLLLSRISGRLRPRKPIGN